MKIRFAITYAKNGNRVLAFRNVAASHYDTRPAAEYALSEYLKNSPHTMSKIFPNARVDAVECYDHCEAVRTVFAGD